MAKRRLRFHALALLAVMALALAVAGCGGGSQPAPAGSGSTTPSGSDAPAPAGSETKETLKIGFMGPITGNWSAWGTDAYNAALLAVEEWNARGGVLGRQIELVVADSQGDPQQAAVLANKLVDQKVTAVIGPTFSLEAEVTVPVFKQNNVVSVTGLADLIDPNGVDGYFRTSPREDNAALFGARFMVEYLKGKSIAIIDDGKSDGVRSAEMLKEALAKVGVTPVFTGSVTPGQQNYAPTLSRVKSLGADVIYLTTLNPDTAVIRKQANELGMSEPFVVGVGNDDVQFHDIAGPNGTGTFTYKPVTVQERFDAFIAAYKARFSQDPGNLNEYTYDAANVLLTAIQQAGSAEADQVKPALKAISAFPGVTGEITFDATGSRASEEFSVLEYQSDQNWHDLQNMPFTTPK